MFWTISIFLFVVWVLGLATDYTGSGLIHILPMVSIAVVLVRLIDRRPDRSLSPASAKTNNNVIQLQK